MCVCVCVSTAPGVCVCVSTAPGVCVCVCGGPLLQVCVRACVCAHLDGLNADNKISLLVILCIIMYVTKKEKSNPIMIKCLNIGKPIYRSVSTNSTSAVFRCLCCR